MAPSLLQVIKAVFRPILRPIFGQIPTPIKKHWQILTVNEGYLALDTHDYQREYERIIQRIYDNSDLPSPTIHVLDIGARDGPKARLEILDTLGKLEYTGIEPDTEECAALNERYPDYDFYPIAFAEREGKRTLYLTQMRSWSSLYKPNEDLLTQFDSYEGQGEVEDTMTVDVDSVDAFCNSNNKRFDFVQMDVQGSEGDVIRGADDTLSDIMGIEFETHFKPVYVGQNLIWDIQETLDAYDVTIIDIDPHSTPSGNPASEVINPDGELLEADIQYLKLSAETRPKVYKQLILSLLLRKRTVATRILKKNESLIPEPERKEVLDLLDDISPRR
ncbi:MULTISPECIES: FkbM family methyltransferase [unclassified Haloarcula]|uniref:FkbM family methyltransferase n=1 Tax=unclassified Haloarcula TaxID=2624677 RepID=UPI0006793523|nr:MULTISPECIES: FkbM family methyltransferase [unclassified Haloarcula]